LISSAPHPGAHADRHLIGIGRIRGERGKFGAWKVIALARTENILNFF